MNKRYIGSRELLQDSFRLGIQIYRSGFRPDFIIGIWRGGTPVGIAVQEYLQFRGLQTDHIAIRTSSYTGINEQAPRIRVHGLHYVIECIKADDKLLLVDDVFDSGRSICAVIDELAEKSRRNMPKTVRIACPWYKPGNNKSRFVPDYYIHETRDWLVFPHELVGLTPAEIRASKSDLADLLDELTLP